MNEWSSQGQQSQPWCQLLDKSLRSNDRSNTAPKSWGATKHSFSEPKQQWVQEVMASVFLDLTSITSWRVRLNVLRQHTKKIAVSWRRNDGMESEERTTPTYHVENTRTPRRASSGTAQPNGTSSLPHCSGDNCVTFTHSTCEWGEEAVVRFTVPYLCSGDNVRLWQRCQGRSNASRATPPNLHHADIHSQATATTEDEQNGKRRGRTRWNHLLI